MRKIILRSTLFEMALYIIVAICFMLGLRDAIKAGPTWDDPTEIEVLNTIVGIQNSAHISYQEAKTKIDESSPGSAFYGIVPQFIAHYISVSVNKFPWSARDSFTLSEFSYRHMVTFCLTWLSIFLLYLTLLYLSKNRILAACLISVLVIDPIFLGLSSVDIKDGPISSGITIFSCGLSGIFFLFNINNKLSPKIVFAFFILILFGSFLDIGTRAGAVALIMFEMAAMIFAALILKKAKDAWGFSLTAISGTFLGVALAVLANPIGRKDPWDFLVESSTYAAHFPTASQPMEMFGKIVMSGHLPWWYIPGWVIVEHPESWLFLIAIGSIVAFRKFAISQASEQAHWLPFAVQGFLLPLCIVISHSIIYDRLRHLLFILPPLGMLAGYGLYSLMSIKQLGFRKIFFPLLSAGLTLYGLATVLIWYPYQYAFLNLIGKSYGDYAFETDYLGSTMKEGILRIAASGVKVFHAGPAPTVQPYNLPPFNLEVGFVLPGYAPHPKPEVGGGAYYIHSRPGWDIRGLPSFCAPDFRIDRQGITLGVGGTC